MEPSHVLVPLDGSPLADAALTHAFSVFECPVTVLNVVTRLDSGMSEGGYSISTGRGKRPHANGPTG